MNKIDKFLLRLPLKERLAAQEIIGRLIIQNWTGLDIKKLKGYQALFRCRFGALRIIFEFESGRVVIVKVGNRSDTTYHF